MSGSNITDADREAGIDASYFCGGPDFAESLTGRFAAHRIAAVAKREKEIVGMIAELRQQSLEAHMRGDLRTADRIAALTGDPLPSDHEKADLKR